MAEATTSDDTGDATIPHPSKERRASRRVRMEIEVGLTTDTNFFVGYSEDLSDGGLFIATYRPLKVGATFDLCIALPEGEPINAHGRVAWVREPLDGVAAGVGVELHGLSDEDRATILEFIGLRAPIFYDI